MRILLLVITCLFLTPAFSTAVVSSPQYLASMAGKQILQEGGNAVDAAVATGYALAVVHPCCGNLGGGGFMVIHLEPNKNIFINFREKAPAAIQPILFYNKKGQVDLEKAQSSFLTVGVPGTVMGLNAALKKYGTMTLK